MGNIWTAEERYKSWIMALWLRLKQSPIGQKTVQALNYLQTHWFGSQIAMILLYRLALDIQYILVLSPVYGYSGFVMDLSLVLYLCSWLVVIGFSPFLAQLNNQKTPSSVLLTMISYLYFLPLTSYVGFKDVEWRFFSAAVLYWFILLLLQHHIPVLSLKSTRITAINNLAILITLFSCGLVMYVSGRYTGFRFVLDLSNVYEIRAEAAAYDLPSILSYALSILPVILSILLVYWLQRKRYLYVAGLIVVYLFLFSIAAHKSIFFFLFLLLAGYFFCGNWVLRWLPGLLTGGMLLSVLERLLLGTFNITGYFVRRMLYVPVNLSYRYYSFFQENPVDLFRMGIMNKLLCDPLYTIGVPRVIGEASGNPQTNANAGLLGDMFSNLPILVGVLLMPLILIICFRLLDLTASKVRINILIPLCVWFTSVFSNVIWSTALLTHGFLIACLLLYFFPKEEHSRIC